MAEEKDRILKLLEEGKITADQAARLIEALGASRPESGFRAHGFRHRPHRFDRIPDIVAEAVSSALSFGAPGRAGRVQFPSGRGLLVKTVSGDIKITGSDQQGVMVESSDSLTRSRQEGDNVVVRGVSGAVVVTVPAAVRLELATVSGDITVAAAGMGVAARSVSGDVRVTQAQGPFVINTVAGDIDLVRCAGELEMKTKSGAAVLVPADHLSGRIETDSADVRLELGSEADLLLDLGCEEEGEIDLKLSFPHEVVEQAEGRLKVKLGRGSRTLMVRTRRADIRVCDIKEAK